jgi:hypothetical protein
MRAPYYSRGGTSDAALRMRLAGCCSFTPD